MEHHLKQERVYILGTFYLGIHSQRYDHMFRIQVV